MEKVYVEVKDGLPINVDVQNAIDGFRYSNEEIKTYTKEDLYMGKHDHLFKKYVFVGSIDAMTYVFGKASKHFPYLDYPEQIAGLIKRKIIKQTKKEFIDQFEMDNEPKFIKPVKTKLFDGIIYRGEHNKAYLHDVGNNDELYVSDLIDIVSEYRCYIHNGIIIHASNYDGDCWQQIPVAYVHNIIDNYKDHPVSFAIDVAILKDGSFDIIEVSDFWAIAGYGLYSSYYSSMLEDRYWEIINES